jgi:hypothetical protein
MSVDLPVDPRMHIGTPLSGDHKIPVRTLSLLFAVAHAGLSILYQRALVAYPSWGAMLVLAARGIS